MLVTYIINLVIVEELSVISKISCWKWVSLALREIARLWRDA